MLVSLEISMLLLFPKQEPPACCDGPLSLFPISKPAHQVSQMKTLHFHVPPPILVVHFLQFLHWTWSSHSHILSAFAFKGKDSYNCHKSVVTKTLAAAPVITFYRTLLIISFLTALPLNLQSATWRMALALQSATWRKAQL